MYTELGTSKGIDVGKSALDRFIEEKVNCDVPNTVWIELKYPGVIWT